MTESDRLGTFCWFLIRFIYAWNYSSFNKLYSERTTGTPGSIKIGFHRPASETPNVFLLADRCWPETLCWLGCHQLKIMLISVEVDLYLIYIFFVRYKF